MQATERGGAPLTGNQPGSYDQGSTGWSARSGFDFTQLKTAVADKLYGAAHLLREQSAQQTEASQVAKFEQRAGDWLARSADYVSELEPQQLRNDLENQVRRNPGRSLLIAGAVGLLLGRLLRK